MKSIEIEFVRPWQGRIVGQVDRLLSPGVAMTLIQYGIAKRRVVPVTRKVKRWKPIEERGPQDHREPASVNE